MLVSEKKKNKKEEKWECFATPLRDQILGLLVNWMAINNYRSKA